MGRQYLRHIKLTVEGANILDVSDFRIRFEIRQAHATTPNHMNVRINNLKSETMQKALREYKSVTLSVGWEDANQLTTIFKGEILQARIGRENVTDTYLHILATSGERARNYGFVNKALAAGHTADDIVQLGVKAYQEHGVQPGFIESLGGQKAIRNFIGFGSAKNILREICEARGAWFHVCNNKLNVYKNTSSLPGNTTVLNSETGLVGLPEQTIYGIEGRCLLNPFLLPGSLVKIDEKSVQQAAFSPAYTGQANADFFPKIAADGIYRLELVEHIGDNRSNEWYTEFVGIRKDDPISPALAERGISGVNQ